MVVVVFAGAVVAGADSGVDGGTKAGDTECFHGEYGFLTGVARQRATILRPGSMFVTQPELPVPLLVTFPFPAWATRVGEAGVAPAAGPGAAPDRPGDGTATPAPESTP